MLGAALLLGIAPIQAGATVDQAADRSECALCARKIELDAARWNCLLRKRDALEGEVGDAVIVQLDPRNCNDAVAQGRKASATSRSGSPDLVVEDRDGERPGLIMLSKRQLRCLIDAQRATKAGLRVSFDFARQCPR